MPISELLWMCPECGEDRGLVRDGSAARCRACAAVFRRGKGAEIVAERPDGTRVARRPAQWLEQIPDVETLVPEQVEGDDLIRSSSVEMARVTDADAVHDRDGYLNRIEIWGEESPGTLELRAERLVFRPQDGPEESWSLNALTAVQASSHSLQLNRRGASLVSFRFLDDSIYLWEELMHAALSAFYARTGRGEIVEFQPRIVTA